MINPVVFILVAVVFWLLLSVKVLNEYERGVIFRLGRVLKEPKGPGFVFVFWPIDRMVKISLRTVVHDIPPQDVITRDNVSVRVNAVLYFRVMDPEKSVIEVENFLFATSQEAQTTLRSVVGQAELDELLAERDRLNMRMQTILDEATDPWGIKVANVEIKHVDLDESMIRAIARQAEAERARRAKVIHAEGEMQASEKLMEAARILKPGGLFACTVHKDVWTGNGFAEKITGMEAQGLTKTLYFNLGEYYSRSTEPEGWYIVWQKSAKP